MKIEITSNKQTLVYAAAVLWAVSFFVLEPLYVALSVPYLYICFVAWHYTRAALDLEVDNIDNHLNKITTNKNRGLLLFVLALISFIFTIYSLFTGMSLILAPVYIYGLSIAVLTIRTILTD